MSCISAGHYQSLFQLTTSRRGRLARSGNNARSGRISTHDLTKRSTNTSGVKGVTWDISTHDLTKRSTRFDGIIYILDVISTHDLTKRSTIRTEQKALSCKHFNSRPHEEVDESKVIPDTQLLYFNSRPHEEVD